MSRSTGGRSEAVPLEQILLTVLGAVIVVNALLVATIPFRARRRRSREADPFGTGRSMAAPTAAQSLANDPDPDGDARAAAAIEAFVAQVSPDAAGRASPPSPAEVLARRDALVGLPSAGEASPVRARARMDAPGAPGQRRLTMAVAARTTPARRAGDGREIAIAGLADPAAWDRSVRAESARVARFNRPVTVVMAELPNIDDVAGRLGRAAADRVVTETARLLVAQGRAVDRIAWLGDARFGVLLVETEELRAGRYIERIRAIADDWLESAGLSVRLSLGWASPGQGGDVMAATAIAQERMRGPDGPPIGVGPAEPRA